MALYSKNGSIPKPQTDGTEGWVEVPEAPTAGEWQEVVWWSPPGWVVRPIKPVKDGFYYSWNQSDEKWVEYAISEVVEAPSEVVIPAETNDTVTLTDGSVETITLSSVEPTISLDLGTGSDTVTGSATPTI